MGTMRMTADAMPGPSRHTFRDDVLEGLSQKHKTIPAKYLYDARGSRLYDEICELVEYYPTRTELGILRERAVTIGSILGPGARVVELGSGSSNKTHALLDGLPSPAQYVLVDISPEPLEASRARLAADYPGLDVRGICADYTHNFALPACAAAQRTVAYFPGSTIGNFLPEDARDFLSMVRRMVGANGALVLGVDVPKDPAILHAAYNDARNVTAEFNKNLLVRMNHELFARFDPSAFWHHAIYEPSHARIEMHLVSRVAQNVPVAGLVFHFDEGESITTEYSYKYTAEKMSRIARTAGFAVDRVWTDEQRLFSVQLLSAAAR